MSQLLEVEPEVRDEPITEPPKRWRNWWTAVATGTCVECGLRTVEGERFTCCGTYPSKDIAETAARDAIEWQKRHNGGQTDIYDGAAPADSDE